MRTFLLFATCCLFGPIAGGAGNRNFFVSLEFNVWEVVPEIACNMTDECIQCFDCALKPPTEPSDGLFISIQANDHPRYSWKFDSRLPNPFAANGQFVNPIVLALDRLDSIQLVARVTHGFWANKCAYEAGEVIKLDANVKAFSVQLQSVCFLISVEVNLIEKLRPNETKLNSKNSPNYEEDDLAETVPNNQYYSWFLASIMALFVAASLLLCGCILALIRKYQKKSKRRQKYEINHDPMEAHKSMMDSMTETDDQLPNLQPIFYPQRKSNGY